MNDIDPAGELHGRGISGLWVVFVSLAVAFLIGLGMVTSMSSLEADESYVPPDGTPTREPNVVPWGR